MPRPDRLALAVLLLQRSKAERYQTAGELETDLRRWLGGQFGRSEAVAELQEMKAKASEALIEEGLRRSRRRGKPADITTA